MAERIAGVLHVILTAKRPRGGLLDRLVYDVAVERGVLQRDYHPPTYYVLTDRTDRSGRHYQYRFRGRPQALAPDLRGHRVTVTAGVDPFGNRLGAYLDRPRVVDVGEYVNPCPYHADDADTPARGTARIHCDRRYWTPRDTTSARLEGTP